jgi:hypothetical protein
MEQTYCFNPTGTLKNEHNLDHYSWIKTNPFMLENAAFQTCFFIRSIRSRIFLHE